MVVWKMRLLFRRYASALFLYFRFRGSSSLSKQSILSFDGSFRNQGISGGGNTMYELEQLEERHITHQPTVQTSETTNGISYYFGNQAQSPLASEWLALIELLYYCQRNPFHNSNECLTSTIFGDSDVIVTCLAPNAINIEFKDPSIMKCFNLATALLRSLNPRPTVRHISRIYNTKSDWLANDALRSRSSQPLHYQWNDRFEKFARVDDEQNQSYSLTGTLFLHCSVGNIPVSYRELCRKMRVVVEVGYLVLSCRFETYHGYVSFKEQKENLDASNTFAVDLPDHSAETVKVSVIDANNKILYLFESPLSVLCNSQLKWNTIHDPQLQSELPVIQLAFLNMCSKSGPNYILHDFAYKMPHEKDLYIISEVMRSLARRHVLNEALQQTASAVLIESLGVHYLSVNQQNCTISIKTFNEMPEQFLLNPFQTAVVVGNSKMVSHFIYQTGLACCVSHVWNQSNHIYNSLHLAVLSGRVGTVSQMLRSVNEQVSLDEYVAVRDTNKLKKNSFVTDNDKFQSASSDDVHPSASLWRAVRDSLLYQKDHQGRTPRDLAQSLGRWAMATEITRFMTLNTKS